MPRIKLQAKKDKRSTQYWDMKRKARQAIYNTPRWKKLRAFKLSRDPLCERCKAKGRVTAASEVHHMTSFMTTSDLKKRDALAYALDNLESICRQCHIEEHKGKRSVWRDLYEEEAGQDHEPTLMQGDSMDKIQSFRG